MDRSISCARGSRQPVERRDHPGTGEDRRQGLIRIVDLIVILKDQDGIVEGVELANFEPAISAALAPLVAEVQPLLSHDGIARVGAGLATKSSAGVLLLEQLWATDGQQAIANAGGRIVDQGLVGAENREATLAEVAALQTHDG